MELNALLNNLKKLILKYKFVILVVLAGLLLMLIPGGKKATEQTATTANQAETKINEDPQDALASVLSQIKGVGRVQVYLTTLEGERIIYQSNSDKSGDNTRTETVTITNQDRGQEGLISQINPPIYLGAIVVCEGADDSTVQLAVTDAVSKATGLGTNRISVLKMK